jgi:hypothetical protein
MHLVYYRLHFLCHGPRWLVKPPPTFSLYPDLHVFLFNYNGAAD